MKSEIHTAILVEEEKTSEWLKDSLSRFSTCKKVSVLADVEEAIEFLNQDSYTLLFLDEVFINLLYTIHKPVFVVPICTKININRMKKLMKMGCFDILLPGNRDEQLTAILGKILNIHAFYGSAKGHHGIVSEKELEYRASMAKIIFTEESIFLPATKSQPSVRILLSEILFLQLEGDKILFYMENSERYERKKSLKYFLNRLPADCFQKINQKTIVNVRKIDQMLRGDTCRIGEMTFKITRSFKNELKSKLPL
ncbi:MAG: LytTR family transcriptional regulator [Bacteroidales bacterium]|nr:LytTR family transcriptional regulator [Bacteroidales bacterium]